MYVGTEVGPFARRMKRKKWWLLAGANLAAILMVIRSQAQSPVVRFGLLAGALICFFIAIWQFNRPPLKEAEKDS